MRPRTIRVATVNGSYGDYWLARELAVVAEFGWRLQRDALMARLCDHVFSATP